MIGNYGTTWNIDNDDSSRYYNSSNNFLVYSQKGMKTNQGGHNNYHINNIYAYRK